MSRNKKPRQRLVPEASAVPQPQDDSKPSDPDRYRWEPVLDEPARRAEPIAEPEPEPILQTTRVLGRLCAACKCWTSEATCPLCGEASWEGR